MFVMYYPFLIEAGKVYKAIPPLYSVKEGKKKRYFTDNLEYIKYIQKTFLSQNDFRDIKNQPISQNDITKFFLRNTDYIYFLEKLANTYAVDPYLTEMVLDHYIENGNKVNFDKLKKEELVYHFLILQNRYILTSNLYMFRMVPFFFLYLLFRRYDQIE